MAIDPKSLTVDFRSLLKMTVQERVEMAKLNPSYLASLTPTQYAMLFPDYYRKQLPDLGLSKATSGATPLGTISGDSESATPLPRYDGSTPKTGVDALPAPPREKPKPSSVLKETWDQRLIREAEEKKLVTTLDKTSPLAKQRQALPGLTTEEKMHMYALTMAEVGRKNPETQKALMETIYNRNIAEGKRRTSLADSMRSDYYEPLRKGKGQWYNKAKNDLQNDPELFARMEALHNEVLSGSNVSNFATHNASGSIAANAVREYDADPNSIRKLSIDEKSSETVYNKTFTYEQEWLADIKGQMEKHEATKVSPSTKDKPGQVIPDRDPGSIGPVTPEPLTALPEGLDPGIVDHYNRLKPEEQKRLLDSMTGVTSETINKYYRENKEESASPQVVREKTEGIISNPEAFGQEVVLEEQQKATRRLPIKENLKDQIEEAVLAVYGPGYKARVYSGGQPGKGTGGKRKGSTRHDYGNAADIYVEGPDGKKLSREEQLALAQYWMKNKFGSVGLGMRGAGMHLDNNWDNKAKNVWGYKGETNSWDFLSPTEKKFLLDRERIEEYVPSYSQFEGFADRVRQIEKERGISRAEARALAREELRKKIETVTPEAPPTEAVAVEPQPNVTGDVVPEGQKGPPGASIIPETAPAAPTPQPKPETAPAAPTPKQPKLEPAPTPTATPVNPPTSKAVGDAMAKVGPPGPNQKDYRDDPAVKAEAASQAPTPTEKPSTEIDPIEVKQDDVPQKKYGGTTQSPTGEPITVSDSQTGQRLFTMNEEETLRKNKYGQIEVTPNTRRDSEEIESLAQKVKDEVRLQSEAREAAAETPMTRMSQQPPQNNPNWSKTVTQISEDSGNVYKTASQGRAFDQARFIPRKDIFSLANATLKS